MSNDHPETGFEYPARDTDFDKRLRRYGFGLSMHEDRATPHRRYTEAENYLELTDELGRRLDEEREKSGRMIFSVCDPDGCEIFSCWLEAGTLFKFLDLMFSSPLPEPVAEDDVARRLEWVDTPGLDDPVPDDLDERLEKRGFRLVEMHDGCYAHCRDMAAGRYMVITAMDGECLTAAEEAMNKTRAVIYDEDGVEVRAVTLAPGNLEFYLDTLFTHLEPDFSAGSDEAEVYSDVIDETLEKLGFRLARMVDGCYAHCRHMPSGRVVVVSDGHGERLTAEKEHGNGSTIVINNEDGSVFHTTRVYPGDLEFYVKALLAYLQRDEGDEVDDEPDVDEDLETVESVFGRSPDIWVDPQSLGEFKLGDYGFLIAEPEADPEVEPLVQIRSRPAIGLDGAPLLYGLTNDRPGERGLKTAMGVGWVVDITANGRILAEVVEPGDRKRLEAALKTLGYSRDQLAPGDVS